MTIFQQELHIYSPILQDTLFAINKGYIAETTPGILITGI